MEEVFLAEADMVGNVDLKGRKAARVGAGVRSVDIHLGIQRDALKCQVDPLATHRLRNRQAKGVPRRLRAVKLLRHPLGRGGGGDVSLLDGVVAPFPVERNLGPHRREGPGSGKRVDLLAPLHQPREGATAPFESAPGSGLAPCRAGEMPPLPQDRRLALAPPPRPSPTAQARPQSQREHERQSRQAMFLGPALMASTASTSIRLRAVTSLRRPSQPYHVPRQLGKAHLEPPLVVQGRSTALLRHHVVGVIHRVGGLGIVVGEHRVPLHTVPRGTGEGPLGEGDLPLDRGSPGRA